MKRVRKTETALPKYRIWVTYHKDELLEHHHLSEDANHRLFATHKDAEKKNINALNPVYSEMVTMWYVWKNNLRTDYVGFEHYRRHLHVSRLPKGNECQIFRVVDFGDKTLYQQYAECHKASDMDLVLSLLDKTYGEDNPYSKHIKESTRLIANCTFLMRWDYFVDLCTFLFPLLAQFGKACGMSDGLGTVEQWHQKAVADFGEAKAVYQRRVVSFLAERLISAFVSEHTTLWNGIDVAIVHYNTPRLTAAAILSLNKRTPYCHVSVFDNSDTDLFVNIFDNVSVIDNTKGKIINFDELIEKYPDRERDDERKSNYGSAKHCRSVEELLKLIPTGFVLMDSDVFVLKDIKGIVSDGCAVSGRVIKKDGIPLLLPFLCWLNVPELRKNKVHYFNGEKMWALSSKYPNNRYDTGAWVIEEVTNKGLKVNAFPIWEYIIHLGHGSWRDKNTDEWLEIHKDLWI